MKTIFKLSALTVLIWSQVAGASPGWSFQPQGVTLVAPVSALSDTLPRIYQHPVRKLKRPEIGRLFTDLKNMDLPWEYTRDCCHERGYLMSQRIAGQLGIPHLRIIVEGNLTPPPSKWGDRFVWVTHTAPAVADTSGLIWVLDPSLAEEPVTLKNWLAKFTRENTDVSLHIGHQYVFNVDDINEKYLEISSFDRPSVMEVVNGGILACWHLQNLKNKSRPQGAERPAGAALFGP